MRKRFEICHVCKTYEIDAEIWGFNRAAFNALRTQSVGRDCYLRQEKDSSIEHSNERACRWIAGLCRRFILAADISIRARRRRNWGLRAKVNTRVVALFLFSSSLPLFLSAAFHYLFTEVKLDTSSQLKERILISRAYRDVHTSEWIYQAN